jgi:hypothetical protein
MESPKKHLNVISLANGHAGRLVEFSANYSNLLICLDIWDVNTQLKLLNSLNFLPNVECQSSGKRRSKKKSLVVTNINLKESLRFCHS